jgi:hypothetical protein
VFRRHGFEAAACIGRIAAASADAARLVVR